MYKTLCLALPVIGCAGEYFFPFYGVWLFVFAASLTLVGVLSVDKLGDWDIEFSFVSLFVLFPAALIICGIEKYNRWGQEKESMQSLGTWLKGDGGIVVFAIGGVLLFIFIVAVIQRLTVNTATSFRDWWKSG